MKDLMKKALCIALSAMVLMGTLPQMAGPAFAVSETGTEETEMADRSGEEAVAEEAELADMSEEETAAEEEVSATDQPKDIQDSRDTRKVGSVILNNEAPKNYVTGDDAYVENISMKIVSDGTADFDEDNAPGNDSGPKNGIVRSFDTVNYRVSFNTEVVHAGDTFNHGYLWIEITLPCSDEVAEIDTSVFPSDIQKIRKTKEQVDGQECTVYRMYYEKNSITENGELRHALPQAGFFPVTMKVNGAQNGVHIKPTIRMAVAQIKVDENGEAVRDSAGQVEAERDYSDFDGAYDTPKKAEGPDVQVSAKPSFNVVIKRLLTGTTKVYDFSTGSEAAIDKEAGKVYGRVLRFGLEVSMENEVAAKGMKGLELPDGNEIKFDLNFESLFGTDAADVPLIWNLISPGFKNIYNRQTGSGYSGATRVPYDRRSGGDFVSPSTDAVTEVWNGGDWTLSRSSDRNKVSVRINNYVVNPKWFPTGCPGNGSTHYLYTSGGKLQKGVFSSQNMEIVVPFGSDINDREEGADPTYAQSAEDPLYYATKYDHTGDVNIVIRDSKLDITGASGGNSLEAFPENGQSVYAPERTNEDKLSAAVKLSKPGRSDRSVLFSTSKGSSNLDVDGSANARFNGQDAAMPGRVLGIYSRYNYTHDEETTWLYATQMLVKFDDEYLTPMEDPYGNELYAAKPDGSGWTDDEEMKAASEGDLYYYASLEALQADGKVCVGVLREFESTVPRAGEQEMITSVKNLKLTSDQQYYNTVCMTSMSLKAWRKDSYDAIVEANGGTFPSHSDPALNGKTVEEYVLEKGNLPEEESTRFEADIDDNAAAKNRGYKKASYDEDGYHQGSGTEAAWGDSLYVVPYKMGVRKFVEQKGGPETDAPVGYSFENKEVVADYCLRPYYTMPDVSSDQFTLSGEQTTVTVSDILPAGLTYLAGSAYIGGTYQGSGPNNNFHGSVEGGEQVDPVVERLSDGTVKLTWRLEGQVIGDDDMLPDIHFAAAIDQDISEYTTWTNSATVQSIEDNRVCTVAGKNMDTALIEAAPSGNLIVDKKADGFFHDAGDALRWKLRWKNTAATPYEKMVLLDVMPYDGDAKGSSFSGSYSIAKLQYQIPDEVKAAGYSFYYTTDPRARQGSGFGLDLPYEDFVGDTAIVNGITWKKGAVSEDGTVPGLEGRQDVAAFALLCDMPAKGEVKGTIDIQPSGNKQGDVYTNTIAAGGVSQTSTIHIIQRGISGTVWKEDGNKVDGARQTGEETLSGVKVVLKVLNGEAYEEYATTITDDKGRYEFVGLPAGTFKVEFANGGDRSLACYKATEPLKEGVHSDINSDGQPLYGEDVFAEINDIVLPEVADMTYSPYYVEHQDLGVWRPDLTVTKTVDASGAEDEDAEADRAFLFRLTVAEGAGAAEKFSLFDGEGETLGTVTGKALSEGYVFCLKHGEAVRFAELPANVEYKLEEYDYEANGYGFVQSLAEGSDPLEGELDENREVNVVNTFVPQVVKVKVGKDWEDAQAESIQGYARPESITASLLRDGTRVDSHVLDQENDWSYTFEELPKYQRDPWPESFSAGPAHEFDYTVEEDLVGETAWNQINDERRFYLYDEEGAIRGYFRSEVSTDEETGEVTILNTFVPAANEEQGCVSFSVKKVDSKGEVITGNPAVFALYSEGSNDVITAETGREDGVAGFVIHQAGRYTLKEQQAPEGYQKTSDEYTVTVEESGKVLVSADEESNRNLFERIFRIFGDGDWNAETLTLTVANERSSGSITLSKQVDKNVVRKGDTLCYDILVTNTGESRVENERVWDVLPEGVAYVSDDSNGVYSLENGRERIDWTIAALGPGETRRFRIKTLVKECTTASEIRNVAYSRDGKQGTVAKDNATVKVVKAKDGIVPVETTDGGQGVATGDHTPVRGLLGLLFGSVSLLLVVVVNARRQNGQGQHR